MVVQSATDARARIIEEQFWAVVANIPGAVYRCACVDAWPIRFISDHIALLCGYPASDFIDNAVRTYGSIIYPDDRPYVVEEIDRALEVGAPYALQYRVLHADGDVRWVSERGRAILGESGERLWVRFKKLLKACEEQMYRAAQRESGETKPQKVGANSGVAFVESMFGRDRLLDSTEKLMANIRLWSMRFDANVEPILQDPEA